MLALRPLGSSRTTSAISVRTRLITSIELALGSGKMPMNVAVCPEKILRLAEALEKVGEKAGVRLKVLVEVNLGREPQKHGVLEEELPALLPRLREMPHLEVLGLMTVPPIGPEAVVRPIFRRLSELADRYGLPERSMGMSDDYEWAVEEGATLVRVGRALFVD